jgi:serine/threonine protein kinase
MYSETSEDNFGFKVGSLVAGRYRISELIAAGGMGLVYKVVDDALNGEVVALKLLNPHLANDQIVFQRFLNEVLVARSLSHPNIVRIHDIGKAENGYSYITMEYVDGISLRDKLDNYYDAHQAGTRKWPALEFNEAVGSLLRILEGLGYAHEQKIIHRDIKPENILLTQDGKIKVADFGTARIVGANTGLTQDGNSMGTPDYMAPEQIAGLELDATCDIYALGLMGYELVTGEKAFYGENIVAIAFKQVNEPIPHFASAELGIPYWFEQVITKAAAKQKSDRFQNTAEFARALLNGLNYGDPFATQSNYGVQLNDISDLNNTQRSLPTVKQQPVAPKNEPELTLDLATPQVLNTGTWTATDNVDVAALLEREERRSWFTMVSPIIVMLLISGTIFGGYFLLRNKKGSLTSQGAVNTVQSLREIERSKLETELKARVSPAENIVSEVKTEPATEPSSASKVEKTEPAPEEKTAATNEVSEPKAEVTKPAEVVAVPKAKTKPEPKPVEQTQAVVVPSVIPSNSSSKVKERDMLTTAQDRFSGYMQSRNGSTKSNLSMSLSFSGENISGTATINGAGSYSVTGKLFSRGLELTLVGNGERITFSGSKRQAVLRGTYINAVANEAGQWQIVQQ